MFRPTPAESSAAMAPTAREHFLGHVQGGPVLLDPLNGPHPLCFAKRLRLNIHQRLDRRLLLRAALNHPEPEAPRYWMGSTAPIHSIEQRCRS